MQGWGAWRRRRDATRRRAAESAGRTARRAAAKSRRGWWSKSAKRFKNGRHSPPRGGGANKMVREVQGPSCCFAENFPREFVGGSIPGTRSEHYGLFGLCTQFCVAVGILGLHMLTPCRTHSTVVNETEAREMTRQLCQDGCMSEDPN